MQTRTFEIPTADGPMPVYEARPDSPRAAVVVVQEAFGVNDHIEDVTRRFADAGYHAVAPHMFHRTGSPRLGYDDFSQVFPHFQEITDERILADVDATVAHLNEAGWGNPQIGIVGFCFGGRVTFLVAAERPLGAAVGFYGGGIVTSMFPQLPSLVDKVPHMKTPWMGLFGDQDASIPVADVERLRTELGAANLPVDSDVVLYEGADHGFHCDARASYHESSARDAWRRTLDWFEGHLARAGVGA